MINAKDMITHVFPLQQMQEAMKTFVERIIDGALKVVVKTERDALASYKKSGKPGTMKAEKKKHY